MNASPKPDQPWFEMQDLARRRMAKSTWIPLLAQQIVHLEGEHWKLGFLEEYFGCVSIRVPRSGRDAAMATGWADVEQTDDGPTIDPNAYWPSGTFRGADGLVGNYLVLKQNFHVEPWVEWHLDQDLVIALQLMRENDSWICPREHHLEVARIRRAADRKPQLLEVRSEHLRDYLNARDSGLLSVTFRSRYAVLAEHPAFDGWASPEEHSRQVEGGKWEGRVTAINEFGMPSGSRIAVFHIARTDDSSEEDVPVLGDADESNVKTSKGIIRGPDSSLIRVSGEIWRNEWIDPGPKSPRIRGEKTESTVLFITDNDGTRQSGSSLIGGGRWLWFSPKVVCDILDRRGTNLAWYTEDTGGIGFGSYWRLHFGVNRAGLLNVYAKDIGLLPEADQRIWAAHNTAPDAGVSEELIAAQVRAEPAATSAAETLFAAALNRLETVSSARFGRSLLRPHRIASDLLKAIHRFQLARPNGMGILCKEIVRLVVERIDEGLLKEQRPTDGREIKSIKRLERLLDGYGVPGRQIVAPLVGVYELRHGEAHLPRGDQTDALCLLLIDEGVHVVQRGKQVIARVADSLELIAGSIESAKLH